VIRGDVVTEEETLRVEIDVAAHVAVVTLVRPERRNALDRGMLAQLRAALVALDANEDVRAIVLTGADPAFCSGVDLKAAQIEPVARPEDGPLLPGLATPLIAAVNGAAVTGGLELVLCCDFAIASERATFSDTHARLGSLPFWGLTARLPAAVGRANACRIVLTGETIDAATAERAGLVAEVMPHSELLGRARAVAAAVAVAEPSTVRALLELLRGGDGNLEELMERERAAALPWHERLAREQHWSGLPNGGAPSSAPPRPDPSPTAGPPPPGR
jgi:enoyl-CoA hydratase/carnithine racemase